MKLRVETPYGWFWVRKKRLVEAYKFVVGLDDSGVTARVVGSYPVGRFRWDSPLLYRYCLEVGIYVDTGNPYVVCRVVDEREVIDEKTKFVSRLSDVVYERYYDGGGRK